MGMRVLLGTVISAVALALWSVLFWVVLAGPGGGVRAVPDEAGLMQTLQAQLPRSGTYYVPMPPQPQPGVPRDPALQSFRQREISGPIALIQFNRRGVDPFSTMAYLRLAAQTLAASLIAALLLRAALPVLEGFVQRVGFVFALGVFAAVAVRLSEPLWWHLPWPYYLHGAVYDAGSWLVAGVVLGAIVKRPRGARHLTDPSKPLWKRALDVD